MAARYTDAQTEQMLGSLLRAGVLLAGVIVAAGGLLFLIRHGAEPPHYRVFRGEPADLRTFSGILGEAAHFSGRGLIQLGLLVLIGTPVARVALSAYAFARERDRLYSGIALAVLTLLLYSLTSGSR